MRTRTQGSVIPVADYSGTKTTWYGGETTVTPMNFSLHKPDYKVCQDEIHPSWRHKRLGGPLSIRELKVRFEDTTALKGYRNAVSAEEYNCAHRVRGLAGSVPPDSLSHCESLGPEAWNRFKPLRPKVNLGQFLVELRDVPELFRIKLKGFKSLGSNYLNYQFGWKPFISDLRRWWQSISKVDAILARQKKNNGKWVRRAGTLFDEFNVTKAAMNPNTCLEPSNFTYNRSGEVTTTVKERAWFEGSFRYYIPGLQETEWGKLSGLSRVWGLNLTPSLLWEVLPWSWLIDWCANTGDVIDNFSSVQFDNMAARDAWVMYQKTTKQEATVRFQTRHTLDGVSTYTNLTCSATYEVSQKSRAKASPFGFGLDLPDFTPYQISILLALGIK